MKLKFLLKMICFLSLSGLLFSCTVKDNHQVVLVAGSDFQQNQVSSYNDTSLKKLLNSLQSSGFDSVDRFMFCGDYVYDDQNTAESMRLMRTLVNDVYSGVTEDQFVFVKGNHDDASLFTKNIIEHEQYSLFLLHESMMPFCAEDDKVLVETKNKLKNYLNDKIEKNDQRVVFIMSHLPLHYSSRTYDDGDGQYASIIFDVINEAAVQGLNIIYLYGHNHSNGYDDYLGGASVFLQPDDVLYVSVYGQQKKDPVSKKLAFTYMNAGYLCGYSTSDASVDQSATVSVFIIEEGRVTIMRYDEKGRHHLKSSGKWNERLPDCLNQTEYEKTRW